MNLENRIIDIINNSKGLSEYEIFKKLKIDNKKAGEFFEILQKNIKIGKIINKSGKYFINNTNMLVGKFLCKSNSLKKYGFITSINNEFEKDFYVPSDYINTAMNNDIVEFEKINQNLEEGKKEEVKIVKIIERANNKFLGTVKIRKNNSIKILADDESYNIYKIKLVDNEKSKLSNNQKVIFNIIEYPTNNKVLLVSVNKIIGNKYDDRMDILSSVINFNVEYEFNSKTLKEAKKIKNKVDEKDIKNRLDLRNEIIVTIDGKTAKDFDDAISVKKLENGNYKLGVHIADVSYYVKKDSNIDKDALKRSTSVYLLDTVIPMLPFELSNEICSLKPNEDRLCLSCIMEINKNGKVVNYDIRETVINSKYRLIYEDISDIIENSKNSLKLKKKYSDILETLNIMEELSKILYSKRHRIGAIEFNFKEAKFDLDKKTGIVKDIYVEDRRIANKIIEEFMLVANETVAEYVYWLNIDFIYRIHEVPDEEKILIFKRQLDNLNIKIKGLKNNIEPKSIQVMLEKISGFKEEKMLNKMLLRSLKRAKYSSKSDIHFGLACSYYTHFTSPIRRYSDLEVHRILKKIIKNEKITKNENLDEIINIINNNFRRAEELERDVELLKKAQYMKNFIGEVFVGVISSITSFGFFVELENTVEGLVHISTIDSFLEYDEERLILYNDFIKYSIGDEVKICVDSVNEYAREINFKLI